MARRTGVRYDGTQRRQRRQRRLHGTRAGSVRGESTTQWVLLLGGAILFLTGLSIVLGSRGGGPPGGSPSGNDSLRATPVPAAEVESWQVAGEAIGGVLRDVTAWSSTPVPASVQALLVALVLVGLCIVLVGFRSRSKAGFRGTGQTDPPARFAARLSNGSKSAGAVGPSTGSRPASTRSILGRLFGVGEGQDSTDGSDGDRERESGGDRESESGGERESESGGGEAGGADPKIEEERPGMPGHGQGDTVGRTLPEHHGSVRQQPDDVSKRERDAKSVGGHRPDDVGGGAPMGKTNNGQSGEDGSGEDGSGEDGSGEDGSGEDGSGEDGSGDDPEPGHGPDADSPSPASVQDPSPVSHRPPVDRLRRRLEESDRRIDELSEAFEPVPEHRDRVDTVGDRIVVAMSGSNIAAALPDPSGPGEWEGRSGEAGRAAGRSCGRKPEPVEEGLDGLTDRTAAITAALEDKLP